MYKRIGANDKKRIDGIKKFWYINYSETET